MSWLRHLAMSHVSELGQCKVLWRFKKQISYFGFLASHIFLFYGIPHL